MNVVQNYLINAMRGDFNIYEIRIFMKVVQQANHILYGQKVSRLAGRAFCTDGISCHFAVPYKEIDPDKTHVTAVKSAARRLKDKDIEFYDADTKTWHLASIIDDIHLRDGDGTIYFSTPKWLLGYIVNFISGNFTLYDLELAMTLSSTYAVRMYWLMCNQKKPITYRIDLLRDLLGLPADKYKNGKDFVRRCVEAPMAMLEKRGMNGYTFEKIMEHGKIGLIKFTPVKRQVERPEQVMALGNLNMWCKPALRQFLQTKCQFTQDELEKNKAVLADFGRLKDWQMMIVKIVRRQSLKGAKKGYVINAMKSCISEGEKANININI